MLLDNLSVVLVKTCFPDNLGMAARACANMGCSSLQLVQPRRWNLERARVLATSQGLPILEKLQIFPCLQKALARCQRAFALTARTGGWRKNILSPEQAAAIIAPALAENEKIALVFGPEDAGLQNAEILLCRNIVHIKTYGASSLNLAQAVLIMLHECARAAAGLSLRQRAADRITLAELEMLEKEFKLVLEQLDCMHGKNPDYFFMQWQNIFDKARLKRHEFDAMMGFCRQIRHKLSLPASENTVARRTTHGLNANEQTKT